MTTPNRQRQRWLTAPLVILGSLLMWIEESLWNWLKWLTATISRFDWVRRIETWIVSLPPYPMMVVFLLPMSILFPFKIMAVYWLARGYWLASLATILAAKILGTAIVARMYVVCKPKMMTIPWFKSLHDWLARMHDQLYTALRSLPLYQAVRARLAAIKRVLIEMQSRLKLRARWRLFRRWIRRQ